MGRWRLEVAGGGGVRYEAAVGAEAAWSLCWASPWGAAWERARERVGGGESLSQGLPVPPASVMALASREWAWEEDVDRGAEGEYISSAGLVVRKALCLLSAGGRGERAVVASSAGLLA